MRLTRPMKLMVDPARVPATTGLADQYGRVAHDLRVSLTDRCNLRCVYCMPRTPDSWQSPDELLTDDEIVRLVTVAVTRLGITDVRYTGGEPLLHRGLEAIIAATARLTTAEGRLPGISITTNAVGLKHRAGPLAGAGLQRVNVSLDTLDDARYAEITQRRRLTSVVEGLDAARRAGLDPIKVNCVPQPAGFRQDAPDLLRFCLSNGYQLRFIEHMPLGRSVEWDRDAIVTREQLVQALTDAGAELTDATEARGAAPAELRRVRFEGLEGEVGIIASVTAPFCRACDRTRLTADGRIRSCLFGQRETDLRGPLRNGADDEEVARLWRQAMWHKPRAHGIDHGGFAATTRPMSAIGG
ncbi:GTP 3',8-cyclase MoaA [Brooklawnia cerclae]|uniref:GTP 3',8-cyclase n=1 Tax=Brooklawnia cerclae TaxID=349934 RepID=A0ABX0SI84_9ACTN|nr:cyclic pyranopterin phosphate synthase [Brooklawnia cerclae]